jgi:hypothetical protein
MNKIYSAKEIVDAISPNQRVVLLGDYDVLVYQIQQLKTENENLKDKLAKVRKMYDDQQIAIGELKLRSWHKESGE